MIQQALELLGYMMILIFGVAVSDIFAGIERSKKNIVVISCFSASALIFLVFCWYILGLEITKELYPFVVHLPLMILLSTVFKCSLLISLSSIFSAYLCCQIPRWFASMFEMIFESRNAFFIVYIPIMVVCFFALYKYVATPVYRLMTQSKKTCLLFGAVPFFYYIFDYVTTIYTNWLYSGSVAAVQFIPSMVSMFYFVFVLIYYAEVQKGQTIQRERDLLEAELKEAKTEFDVLRRMQEQTRRYRHDMRHHFTLLQSLAAKGDMKKIADYLQIADSDLDALTPIRYCENETINLLLSSFHAKAEQAGVVLSAEACVPKTLPISDTELCSLISNGLENAITAVAAIPMERKRTVTIKIIVYKEKLLLSVNNPYEGKITFREGIPQAAIEGHGYGTRSISTIAELHGGQALFSADGAFFSLQVMVPLK